MARPRGNASRAGGNATHPSRKYGRWSRAGAAAALAALALVAHGPGLANGYIDWDDDYYVRDNRVLDAPDGLLRIWTRLETPQYYPLTYTSYWLEHAIWGDAPAGYHATNLALHAANAILVWLLVGRLGGSGALAWLTAALFAVHPVNVASVAWIAERKNTLSGLFFLLSFIVFLGWRRRGGAIRYGVVLACFVGAMLSKTAAATLPLSLLWLEWLEHGRLTKRGVTAVAPMLAIAVALGLITIRAETSQPIDLSLLERFLIATWAIWFYALKLIVPVGLAGIYPRWDIAAGSLSSYLPLAGLVAAGALVAAFRKKMPLLAMFGTGHFLISLAPTLGLIRFGYMEHSFVADHFVYMASVGLLLAVSTVAVGLSQRLRPRWKPVEIGGIATCVVFGLAAASWQRTKVWHDPMTFWQDVLAKNPECVAGYYNLGVAFDRLGKTDKAIEFFDRALQRSPQNADAWTGLGIIRLRQGQHEPARDALRRAIQRQPGHPTAHYYLGLALEQLGQLDMAEQAYRRAIAVRPGEPDRYLQLGNLLAAQQRFSEAAAAYRQAIAVQPSYAEAAVNLGNVLTAMGQVGEALKAYDQALQADPHRAEAYYNKATVLVRGNRIGEAIQALEQLLALRPDDPAASNALAWILATSADGRYRDGWRAIGLARTAVQAGGRADPRYLSTLAAAYAETGAFAEATEAQRRALSALPAGDAQIRQPYEQRLRQYESGQPVREPTAPPPPRGE